MNVAVITCDTDFVHQLADQIQGEFTFTAYSDDPLELESLNQRLSESSHMLTLVGPSDDHEMLCQLVSNIESEFPQTGIVALSAHTQKEAVVELFRAGASEVVTIDSPPDALVGALRACRVRVERRAGPSAPIESMVRRRIAMLGPKGGVGKTTIATHLAIELAKVFPDEVALVDLDLQFGDVAPILQLSAVIGITEFDGGDEADLGAVGLAKHSSGLNVLTAPQDLLTAESVSAAQIAGVLAALSQQFHYVIVDTAAGVNEATLVAVDQATDLLLVTTTDITSVRAIRRQMDAFAKLRLAEHERHLIINRGNNKHGLSIGDVEQTIGLKAFASIPSSPDLASCLNRGMTLGEVYPRDKAQRSFQELAQLLLPAQLEGAGAGGKQRQTRRWGR